MQIAPTAPADSKPLINIFSVDVEDYFQVEAFSDIVSRDRWSTYTLRVEANTRHLLDLLDEQGVEATFSSSAGSPSACLVSFERLPPAATSWHVTPIGIG